MSKRLLLSIALSGCCLGCFSQAKLVKDAEHILATAKPDYQGALNTIKPALTNDETKDDVLAWFYAGKAAIGVWDKMFLSLQLGQGVKDEDKKNAAHILIDANAYLSTALPLDSLPDAKGKVKPRHSKEIRKMLAKAYKSYRNAGIFLYDLKDFNGAFDAWEIYVNMPEKLNASHRILKSDDASGVGQILYYQAICAFLTEKNDVAVNKFLAARSSGFSNKDLYRYGMEAARREGNDSLMLDFAMLGHQLYGQQDVTFTLPIINNRLQAKNYEECRLLAEDALKVQSNDNVKCQLYDVIGTVCEEEGDVEGAITNYQKSVVFNPKYAKGYFDLARVIYNEALRMAEEGSDDDGMRAIPGFQKAADYFEKAYELDNSLTQIPETLYSLYYRLGVGYEDKASYWQRKQK